MPGDTPSSRRAIAAFTPAANAMPMVCAERIAGYASTDVDSRVQTLSALDSIQRNSASTRLLSEPEFPDSRAIRPARLAITSDNPAQRAHDEEDDWGGDTDVVHPGWRSSRAATPGKMGGTDCRRLPEG